MDKQGYPKIASFMADHPEDATFRRFASLNLQNILYLQAEITGLEKDLRKLEADSDASNDCDRRHFSFDWYTLAHTHDEPTSGQQWEKWMQLRRVLREYNDAVFQYCQISKIPDPEPHELRKFQNWLREPRLGGVYLLGRDHDTWAQGVDLMSLSPSLHPNRISKFITNKALPVSAPAAQQDAEIVTYEYSRLVSASNLICTIIASLLPILAIVVLYVVENQSSRLGLVGLFSVAFSSALWFMNDGELVEVFSATSA
ncbi:hypothetical protein F4678DRAFT_464028 [Xylaria arbuscula]|nr:hypothetical protein F4678DRAFT_464028 [Xylaria arbuscula]